MEIFFVGIGGFLGASGRYLLTRLCNQLTPPFPFGTLLSNVIAALLIGFIIGMERQSVILPQHTRLFLITGLLGGLSTFSAFSIETVRYLEKGEIAIAAGNIILNVGLSLVCVFIGLAAARAIVKTV